MKIHRVKGESFKRISLSDNDYSDLKYGQSKMIEIEGEEFLVELEEDSLILAEKTAKIQAQNMEVEMRHAKESTQH